MLNNPWIYLLRHGEIDSTGQSRFIGQMDEPLSARGIVQALWWRKRWASTTFTRVYCSDLVRSEHTAELIAGTKRDQIQVVSELREIHLGDWEGRSVKEIKRTFPGDWSERGSRLDEYRPPGGESFSDLSNRVLPFFQQILSQVTGPVLIAGHAGVNRVILCRLLGIPLKNVLLLAQDYGALNIIEPVNSNWRLRKMNLCPTIPEAHPSSSAFPA